MCTEAENVLFCHLLQGKIHHCSTQNRERYDSTETLVNIYLITWRRFPKVVDFFLRLVRATDYKAYLTKSIICP